MTRWCRWPSFLLWGRAGNRHAAAAKAVAALLEQGGCMQYRVGIAHTTNGIWRTVWVRWSSSQSATTAQATCTGQAYSKALPNCLVASSISTAAPPVAQCAACSSSMLCHSTCPHLPAATAPARHYSACPRIQRLPPLQHLPATAPQNLPAAAKHMCAHGPRISQRQRAALQHSARSTLLPPASTGWKISFGMRIRSRGLCC